MGVPAVSSGFGAYEIPRDRTQTPFLRGSGCFESRPGARVWSVMVDTRGRDPSTLLRAGSGTEGKRDKGGLVMGTLAISDPRSPSARDRGAPACGELLSWDRGQQPVLRSWRLYRDEQAGRGRGLPLKTQRMRFEWGTNHGAIKKPERLDRATCPQPASFRSSLIANSVPHPFHGLIVKRVGDHDVRVRALPPFPHTARKGWGTQGLCWNKEW